MALTTDIADLTRAEYEKLRKLIYDQVGINLGEQKMQLVRSRLAKRVRDGKFAGYGEYIEFARRDASGQELTLLIDAISTNTTHLFRENKHFEFLTELLKKWWTTGRGNRNQVKIWSAACSSGEEPYSIAMTCDDVLRGFKSAGVKIFASDISTRVLEKAQAGVYMTQQLANVPAELRQRCFTKLKKGGEESFQVNANLRAMITFSRLNLMSASFPLPQMDVIFCRNVMIYFDKPTQQTLVNKFAKQLTPGGYLMIGHSESLNGVTHPLTYVMPTIYQKPA